MLSLSDALAKVKRNCAPDVDPVLSDPEITDILTDGLDISVWLPSTAYAWGQIVVPTIPLGRRYICVLAGTSDTTEPQWLIAPAYTGPINPLGGGWWGLGIVPFIENVSGTPWFFGLPSGTAAFRDYGPFVGEVYDVRAATYEAWMLKAQKASSRVDSSIPGGPSAHESQTYAMCMSQARRFQPIGFF
jgi:hypothetical protein